MGEALTLAMRAVVALVFVGSALLAVVPGVPAGPLDRDDVVVALPSSQVEFSIAADPEDADHLVATGFDYSQGDAWPLVYVSRDGGSSWSSSRLPLPSLYTAGGDPSVVFHHGAVVIAGIAFNRGATNGGANALFVSRSPDGGASWTTTTPFTHPCCFGSEFYDKPYLTRDPASGALFMPYTFVGAPPGSPVVRFTQSLDGGSTWTPPVGLDSHFTFPMAVGAEDGSILAAWLRFGSIRVARSTDDGATFTRVLDTPASMGSLSLPFRTYAYPVLDVARGGPSAGRVFLVVPQLNGAEADLRLYVSNDHGGSWTNAGFLEDPGAPVMPWLAVHEGGTVGVQWTQALGTSTATLTNVRFARLAPGAGLDAWDVATVQDFPARAPGPSTFWGDYNGLAASELAFHPAVVFPSTSTGLDFMTQRLPV